MNRYFSEFKTSRSNSDRLLMIGTNGVDPFDASVNPNVVELTLSADPISISSSDNTSIFAPVKSSGCTVSIVSDKYHFDLYSSRYNDVIGYILDENDNILFYGFNTPNIYQQDWLSLDTIELEFISALSATEYCDYRYINPNGTHTHSMWTIIKFILEEVGYDEKFKIKLYADVDIDNKDDIRLLRYYLNEENFFDDSEDRKPWKMKEVLEEIMRFMGYTLFVHHDTIYIIDYQSLTSSNTFWQYENNDFIKIENTYAPWKIDETYYAGAGAVVSLDMTYNKVTCTANTYPIDNLLDDIFDEDVISISNTRKVQITTPNDKPVGDVFISDISTPYFHAYPYDESYAAPLFENTITSSSKNGWHYWIRGEEIKAFMFRQGKQPTSSIDPGDFDTTDILCVQTGMPCTTNGAQSDDSHDTLKQLEGLYNLLYDQFKWFKNKIQLKPMFTIYGRDYIYSGSTDRYIILTGDVKLSNAYRPYYNIFDIEDKEQTTIVKYGVSKEDSENGNYEWWDYGVTGPNWKDSIGRGIHLIPVRISIGDKYYVNYNIDDGGGEFTEIQGWYTLDQIQNNGYPDYSYINVGGKLTQEASNTIISLNTNEWTSISTNFLPNATTEDLRPNADSGWAIKIPANQNISGTLKIEVLNLTYDFYDMDYAYKSNIKSRWILNKTVLQVLVSVVSPDVNITDITKEGLGTAVPMYDFTTLKPYYNWTYFTPDPAGGSGEDCKGYYYIQTKLPTCMLFKSFEAALVGEINIVDEMDNGRDDDTEYTNIINESFVEEFDDLEVSINTQDKKKKPSYSSVYLKSNNLITELQKVNYNGKSLLQEEHLVEKYVNHYSTPKRIVEMTTKYKKNDANESFPSPENVVNYELFAGDTKFIVSGIEEDIKNETCGITLIEV